MGGIGPERCLSNKRVNLMRSQFAHTGQARRTGYAHYVRSDGSNVSDQRPSSTVFVPAGPGMCSAGGGVSEAFRPPGIKSQLERVRPHADRTNAST
jgi:hypothetical protein